MRKNWKNKLRTITIFSMLLLLASCNKNSDHTEDGEVFTCPMHPTVISDKQGTCPICGMELVRKGQPSAEAEIGKDLSTLTKSPNQTVVSSIRTIKPAFKSVPISIQATGTVTHDARNIYTISARVGGRIEKMYLKYEFQQVRKNQKIAEIYSPELITAQRELLYLLDNDRENEAMVESARRKVSLLGLTPLQIREVIESKVVSSVFAIYSPYDGYVMTRGDLPLANLSAPFGEEKEMSNMSEASGRASGSVQNSPASRGILIREGTYVSPGETLFKLLDTKGGRIELNLPGAYTGMVARGDKLKLDLDNNRTELALVDFVQPFFNEGENFLKIRVNVGNVGNLHIGQLVRSTIFLPARESLWIPKQAAVDLGTDLVVFIKERDTFKPKIVVAGIRMDELIEVKGGLASSDEIASNAQYLVDSESFIKPVE